MGPIIPKLFLSSARNISFLVRVIQRDLVTQSHSKLSRHHNPGALNSQYVQIYPTSNRKSSYDHYFTRSHQSHTYKIIYIAVWRRATDRKQRRLGADRHILCKGVPYSTEMNLLTDSPEYDATILVVSHSRT